jgi:hypothetical protein
MNKKFIEFTDETNAIDYLSKVPFFLKSAETNRKDWKWVIIALHGALYGFAVCAVKSGDSSHLKTKAGRLKPIGQVIELCKNPELMRSQSGRTELILEEGEEKALSRLKNEIRNNFEHFHPNRTWYISEFAFIPTTETCLSIIEKLHPRLTDGCFLSKNQHIKIRSHIFQARKILKQFLRKPKL